MKSKVKSAIKANLTLGQKLFGNQDDIVGFAHVAFTDAEIADRVFEFPEIADEEGSNRYVLSGRLTVGAVPPPPVDRYRAQREALQAKRDDINGLHLRKTTLQQQLATATPQAKPAIIDQIVDVSVPFLRLVPRCRRAMAPTASAGETD